MTMPTEAPVILPFDRSHPFIWDNDANQDVFTLEFVMVLAHNRTINLAGITQSLHPYRTVAEDLQAVVSMGRNSGLRNVPDAAWDLGEHFMTALTRPESGAIDDTQALDTQPARFMRDTVLRSGTAQKPVVVGAGGALTTVASAYLLARTDGRAEEFAARVIVCANNADLRDGLPSACSYNTHQDPWAAYICHCRLPMAVTTNIGHTGLPIIWDFIETLPDCQLKRYMQWKKGEPWPYPDLHGDGDAWPVLAFLRPRQGQYFTGAMRMVPDGWAPWHGEKHGFRSLNWNAHLACLRLKRADKGAICLTGYDQAEAERIWREEFTKAFSR